MSRRIERCPNIGLMEEVVVVVMVVVVVVIEEEEEEEERGYLYTSPALSEKKQKMY